MRFFQGNIWLAESQYLLIFFRDVYKIYVHYFNCCCWLVIPFKTGLHCKTLLIWASPTVNIVQRHHKNWIMIPFKVLQNASEDDEVKILYDGCYVLKHHLYQGTVWPLRSWEWGAGVYKLLKRECEMLEAKLTRFLMYCVADCWVLTLPLKRRSVITSDGAT